MRLEKYHRFFKNIIVHTDLWIVARKWPFFRLAIFSWKGVWCSARISEKDEKGVVVTL